MCAVQGVDYSICCWYPSHIPSAIMFPIHANSFFLQTLWPLARGVLGSREDAWPYVGQIGISRELMPLRTILNHESKSGRVNTPAFLLLEWDKCEACSMSQRVPVGLNIIAQMIAYSLTYPVLAFFPSLFSSAFP